MRLPADHRRRPAAAATEMALLLPFVALLFVGAVDFCRVYYSSQTVQNCARSGALYASGVCRRDPSTSAARAATDAAAAAGGSLDPPPPAHKVVATTGNSPVT